MSSTHSSQKKPRKQQQRSLETKQKIVQAAAQSFSENSFDGVTMRDIANRADVSLGLLTYHFSDKEQLWKRAAEELVSPLHATILEAIYEAMEARGEIKDEQIVKVILRYLVKNPAFLRFNMLSGIARNPRLEWMVDNFLRPVFELSKQRMEEKLHAQEEMKDLNVDLYLYAMMGAITSVFGLKEEFKYLTGSELSEEEMAQELFKVISYLFLSEPNPPASSENLPTLS